MTLKGILTDCITGKESIIDMEYDIIVKDGRRIFRLLNGVTGWESFYIDPPQLPFPPDHPITKLINNPIERTQKSGWLACVGTKGKYDRLFIPPEEMQKIKI